MTRFTTYDRWGNQTGTLRDIIDAKHDDPLDALDTLTVDLPTCDLAKGDRVVWRDRFGDWHEHVVSDIRDVHEGGRVFSEVYCENSMAEMLTDHVDELRPYGVSAAEAVTRVLTVTRWSVGTISVAGVASASLYHTSALEALQEIRANWGGELWSTIEVVGSRVVARYVNLTTRGSNLGKRFEWTKDISTLSREITTDDVVTALYGYGKGLEAYDEDGNPTGGYHRRLTFGDVNDGLDYVFDDEAKEMWGLPDGEGGIKHAFGRVVFEDCEDAEELLALTQAELDRRKQPQVAYKLSVIDLADAGYEWEDVRTGDVVQIVDRPLGVRAQGRVLEVERHPLGESPTVVTIGNVAAKITDVIAQALGTTRKLGALSAAWSAAASISANYMQGVLRSLNYAINQTGGYTYITQGDGIRTYDVAVSDPLVGAEASKVVEVKGGSIRIANTRTSQGDWDWKTVFQSGHVAAELVTALAAVAGTIRSASGSTVIDLDNDSVTLGLGTRIGDVSLVDALDDARKYATEYLHFDPTEGLTIGATDSAVRNVLTSSRQVYRTDAGDIAWYGLGEDQIWRLFIDNAQVNDMLQFGNFAWIARSNGNMTVKWLGA